MKLRCEPAATGVSNSAGSDRFWALFGKVFNTLTLCVFAAFAPSMSAAQVGQVLTFQAAPYNLTTSGSDIQSLFYRDIDDVDFARSAFTSFYLPAMPLAAIYPPEADDELDVLATGGVATVIDALVGDANRDDALFPAPVTLTGSEASLVSPGQALSAPMIDLAKVEMD